MLNNGLGSLSRKEGAMIFDIAQLIVFLATVVITCEDSLNLSQIAKVREKAIAIAKELSVGHYMKYGDEDMR